MSSWSMSCNTSPWNIPRTYSYELFSLLLVVASYTPMNHEYISKLDQVGHMSQEYQDEYRMNIPNHHTQIG